MEKSKLGGVGGEGGTFLSHIYPFYIFFVNSTLFFNLRVNTNAKNILYDKFNYLPENKKYNLKHTNILLTYISE